MDGPTFLSAAYVNVLGWTRAFSAAFRHWHLAGDAGDEGHVSAHIYFLSSYDNDYHY